MIGSVPWCWMQFFLLSSLYSSFITKNVRVEKRAHIENNNYYLKQTPHSTLQQLSVHMHEFRCALATFATEHRALYSVSYFLLFKLIAACAFTQLISHISFMETMCAVHNVTLWNTCVRRNWEKLIFSCASFSRSFIVYGPNCGIIDAAAEKCIEFIQLNEPEIAP